MVIWFVFGVQLFLRQPNNDVLVSGSSGARCGAPAPAGFYPGRAGVLNIDPGPGPKNCCWGGAPSGAELKYLRVGGALRGAGQAGASPQHGFY